LGKPDGGSSSAESSAGAAVPDIYYVTDHYLGYTTVLVRLSRVTPDVLRDLLGEAHKFVTADAARRSPSRNRRKPVWFWLWRSESRVRKAAIAARATMCGLRRR